VQGLEYFIFSWKGLIKRQKNSVNDKGKNRHTVCNRLELGQNYKKLMKEYG
jgi:hypothetical protein